MGLSSSSLGEELLLRRKSFEGGGLRGFGRVPHLAVRRPHPGLARQGRRRPLHGGNRPRRVMAPPPRSWGPRSAIRGRSRCRPKFMIGKPRRKPEARHSISRNGIASSFCGLFLAMRWRCWDMIAIQQAMAGFYWAAGLRSGLSRLKHDLPREERIS